MSNEPINSNQNDSKTKFSLKDALFGGGGGTAGTNYQIIYFSTFVVNGMNGPEPTIYVIYGDNRFVFTNMFPAISVVFSYNNDVQFPTIKLNKRFLPGGTKAEIIIPIGYSFMGVPMQNIVLQAQNAQSKAETESTHDPNVKYQDPYAGVTKLEEQIAPDMDKIDQIIKAQYENETNEDEQSSFIPPETQPKIVDTSDVIQEEEFVATFDENALSEKINKFMEKQNIDPPQKTSKKKKDEPDSRTIEEVKKETVDQEVDRIIKNAENIRDATFEETELSAEIEESRPSARDHIRNKANHAKKLENSIGKADTKKEDEKPASE